MLTFWNSISDKYFTHLKYTSNDSNSPSTTDQTATQSGSRCCCISGCELARVARTCNPEDGSRSGSQQQTPVCTRRHGAWFPRHSWLNTSQNLPLSTCAQMQHVVREGHLICNIFNGYKKILCFKYQCSSKMIFTKHVKWIHRINEPTINGELSLVLQIYLSILNNFLVIIFTYITCMYS